MPEAQPLYELIYGVLKEQLDEGVFPPGLVFGEAVVARAFGSSRIPAAAALIRLKAEGRLKSFSGRGLVAPRADTKVLVRAELVEAGLRLPATVASSLEVRNHHGRIYPQVEHTIAVALPHGRFQVNESALAEHYGVSRTVAHEVLTRLARSGLIAQEGNQRWYAGPLSVERLREHFEMRWLLEPAALGQSMDALDPNAVMKRRANVVGAMTRALTPLRLERLETELHVHTVLQRANAQMVESIRRNQLLVIPTHSMFASQPHIEELGRTLDEHVEIYDLVLAGRKKAAMGELERHIRQAVAPNIARLEQIKPMPDSRRPSFLFPAEKRG
jgi:DNA-binding GntR family transcriptional regulator